VPRRESHAGHRDRDRRVVTAERLEQQPAEEDFLDHRGADAGEEDGDGDVGDIPLTHGEDDPVVGSQVTGLGAHGGEQEPAESGARRRPHEDAGRRRPLRPAQADRRCQLRHDQRCDHGVDEDGDDDGVPDVGGGLERLVTGERPRHRHADRADGDCRKDEERGVVAQDRWTERPAAAAGMPAASA
jgi:hypothetical protein